LGLRVTDDIVLVLEGVSSAFCEKFRAIKTRGKANLHGPSALYDADNVLYFVPCSVEINLKIILLHLSNSPLSHCDDAVRLRRAQLKTHSTSSFMHPTSETENATFLTSNPTTNHHPRSVHDRPLTSRNQEELSQSCQTIANYHLCLYRVVKPSFAAARSFDATIRKMPITIHRPQPAGPPRSRHEHINIDSDSDSDSAGGADLEGDVSMRATKRRRSSHDDEEGYVDEILTPGTLITSNPQYMR
jgi:hypothetical protein